MKKDAELNKIASNYVKRMKQEKAKSGLLMRPITKVPSKAYKDFQMYHSKNLRDKDLKIENVLKIQEQIIETRDKMNFQLLLKPEKATLHIPTSQLSVNVTLRGEYTKRIDQTTSHGLISPNDLQTIQII